jgi:protein-S-isoprenylcysteine O-methyltransferase Ste14
MIIAAIGLALMVPNPISIAGLVFLVIAIELQVRVVEEPHLRRLHGATYGDYCSHVGRFRPRIRQG